MGGFAPRSLRCCPPKFNPGSLRSCPPKFTQHLLTHWGDTIGFRGGVDHGTHLLLLDRGQ
jgi:hypothetical protein